MNRFALMKCRPYLYIRLVLPSVCPFPSPLPSRPPPGASFRRGPRGLPIRKEVRLGPALLPPPHPRVPPPKPSIRLLSSIQSDENTVNALIGVCFFVWFFFLVLFHIMCNVVALTFYATIYEDLCCTCNKYIEKAHIRTVRFMVFVRVSGAGWGVGFVALCHRFKETTLGEICQF